MAGGTIAAAIIGSVTAAATTTSSIITASVQRRGKSVGCIFSNKTRYSWDVRWYEPNHGVMRMSGPNHRVIGFNEFKDQLQFNLPTSSPANGVMVVEKTKEEQLQDLISEWARSNLLESKVSDWLCEWDYEPHGRGVEGMTLLTSTELKMAICCLARKKPGGNYGAGAWMFQMESPKELQQFIDGRDDEGSEMMDFIKKNDQSTNDPRLSAVSFSDGEGTHSATLSGLTIKFTPGGIVNFELVDNGFDGHS